MLLIFLEEVPTEIRNEYIEQVRDYMEGIVETEFNYGDWHWLKKSVQRVCIDEMNVIT